MAGKRAKFQVVKDDFRRNREQFETGVKRGLRRAGDMAAAEAKRKPTKYRIGGILDTIQPTNVESTRKGYAVAIRYGDWRGPFFEKGTYNKTRVKAGHFLRTGARKAWPNAIETINREL